MNNKSFKNHSQIFILTLLILNNFLEFKELGYLEQISILKLFKSNLGKL